MTYCVKYYNWKYPQGHTVEGYEALEESAVVNHLRYLWNYPLHRVTVTDNDNGNVVYNDTNASLEFHPFGEATKVKTEPPKEPKRSVLEI